MQFRAWMREVRELAAERAVSLDHLESVFFEACHEACLEPSVVVDEMSDYEPAVPAWAVG